MAAMEDAIKENKEETDSDMQVVAMGIAGFLKPMAVSMVKEMIVASLDTDEDTEAQTEAGKDISLKRIKTLSKGKGRASVELIVLEPETEKEIRLILGLSKGGDCWKIDDVSNSTEILKNWEMEPEDILADELGSLSPTAE